jgi:hypothetical protein
VTPIAPPYGVSIAPATQRDGGRVGTGVPYTVSIRNLGFNADSLRDGVEHVGDDVLTRPARRR